MDYIRLLHDDFWADMTYCNPNRFIMLTQTVETLISLLRQFEILSL